MPCGPEVYLASVHKLRAVGGGGGDNNLSELGAKWKWTVQEKIINASKMMEVIALIL